MEAKAVEVIERETGEVVRSEPIEGRGARYAKMLEQELSARTDRDAYSVRVV